MNLYRKNLMVGVTMLFGLVLLAFMIIKFGDVPAKLIAGSKTPVTFDAARADGLTAGSSINYLGVNVGSVSDVHRSPDQTYVIINALVDSHPRLPANLEGRIRSQLVGGGSSLNLELTGPVPQGELEPHARLKAEYVGVDVLPPEFASLAKDLRLTSAQFRNSHLIDNLNQTLRSVREQVEHAGTLVDHFDKTVVDLDQVAGDPKMRDDLRASIAQIRTATATADRISANLEKFSQRANQLADTANTTLTKTDAHMDQVFKQLADRLDTTARVLDNLRSITAKIDTGKGTAGLFLNDPKLYQSLVDTSRELNLTITDLKRLVEQWEQEGLHLNLGK
jgi:phospholipid/cholesterol/gamma-HCH transport system substrate-binding protein